MEKHLYAVNEDSVSEYIVAYNKEQAVGFAGAIWGASTLLEYYEESREDFTPEEFVNSFASELDEDLEFSLETENGVITKTIKEHLKDITESSIPCYFGHQNC